MTTATLTMGDESLTQTAICGKKDVKNGRFSLFYGRKLALQRAIEKTTLSEGERLRVWVAFFARETDFLQRKVHELTSALELEQVNHVHGGEA